MIVTATELANESKSILDRVVQGGEVVEVQRHGKTVAVLQPRVRRCTLGTFAPSARARLQCQGFQGIEGCDGHHF